jgi:hypothetical protein
MPSNLDKKGMAVYEMQQLPNKISINPFSSAESDTIIGSFISELNEKFLTKLGDIYSTSDADGEQEDNDSTKLIFVGCSHAKRMAAAAERQGINHSVITLPGYRITAAAVEAASEQLQDEVQTSEGRVLVIFTIYDNNAFFGVGDDGTKTLPVKLSGGDGYHVPGRLEVADHGVIKALVNSSISLLRSAGEKEKIIISPLPRYIIPCCGDEEHITNRTEENFKVGVVDGLSEVRRSLKDLIFGKKLRNFKVMDPLDLMYGDDEEGRKRGCWNPLDPIHPSSAGYDALVQGLLTAYADTTFNRQYTPQRGGGGDMRHRRQSWVVEDDTTAHRNYGYPAGRGAATNWRGRARGGRRGGHGGGRSGGRGSGSGRGGGSGRGNGFKFVRPRGYKAYRGKPY